MLHQSKELNLQSANTQQNTSHNINSSSNISNQHYPKKPVLQRKPMTSSKTTTANSTKKSTSHKPDISPRFLSNTKFMAQHDLTLTEQSLGLDLAHQDGTAKKEPFETSISKSRDRKLDESADYYKYWKKKANQYQQANFTLHRLNCSLQQQNEILKYKYDRLQKKMQKKAEEPQLAMICTLPKEYQKLQQYYKTKLDQMSKKLQNQQQLINRQQSKIKQLSKYISQNQKLKSILNNMEDKVSQLRSVASKDSRMGSVQHTSRFHHRDCSEDSIDSKDGGGSVNRTLYGMSAKRSKFGF